MKLLTKEQIEAANELRRVNIYGKKIELEKGNNLGLTISEIEKYNLLVCKLPANIIDFPIEDDNHLYYSRTDLNGQADYYNLEITGGSQGLLVSAFNNYKELNTILLELKEKQNTPEFPEFGKWDRHYPPQYFILKHGILNALSYYFESDFKPEFENHKQLNTFIVQNLKKSRTEIFSYNHVSKLWGKTDDLKFNTLLKKYNLNEDLCLDFIEYTIKYFKALPKKVNS